MLPFDTLFMSLGAILSNKLRSILTLVGIVAGVASIIAVMTGISVVQGTMEKEMSVLGAQTFQVQKWPAGGFQFRRAAAQGHAPAAAHPGERRRHPGAGRKRGPGRIRALGLRIRGRVQGRDDQPERLHRRRHARVRAQQHALRRDSDGTSPRWTSAAPRNVAVIGYAIGKKLFPFVDPIGRDIRVDGRKYEVIGVFDEKKSAFGGNFDNYVLIPVIDLRQDLRHGGPGRFRPLRQHHGAGEDAGR